MTSRERDVDIVHHLENRIKDIENAGEIEDLIKFVHSDDDKTTVEAITSLERVFLRYLKKNLFCHGSTSKRNEALGKAGSDLVAVSEWIRSKYLSYLNILKDLLMSESELIQVTSLSILMKFEGVLGKLQAPVYFGNFIYGEVIQRLVLRNNFNATLLNLLGKEYFKYEDIRYFTMVNIIKAINHWLSTTGKDYEKHPYLTGESSQSDHHASIDVICENIFLIIRCIQPHSSQLDYVSYFVDDGKMGQRGMSVNRKKRKRKERRVQSESKKMKKNDNSSLSTTSEPGGLEIQSEEPLSKTPSYVYLKEHKKVFQRCWVAFLQIPRIPKRIFSLVLSTLHKNILPHFVRPIVLMDFLTECYNLGGTNAILALSGLFTLIIEHNLDYPEFYPKLYSLLTPSLYYETNCDRFFELMFLFLKSPMLPTYMVSAFIKKLTRLSYGGSPSFATMALPIVYHLFILHPNTINLIHSLPKSEEPGQLALAESLKDDPYDHQTSDVLKSNANDSSLWELEALASHYSTTVAGIARQFFQPLHANQLEFPVSHYLTQNFSTIFEKEAARKLKRGVPLAPAIVDPTSSHNVFPPASSSAFTNYPHLLKNIQQ